MRKRTIENVAVYSGAAILTVLLWWAVIEGVFALLRVTL